MARRAYRNTNTYHGFTAPSGEHYVIFDSPSGQVFIPVGAFHYQPKEGFELLKKHGKYVVGSACGRLIEGVDAISSFPPKLVAERIGWNGSSMFALQDQTVIKAGATDDAAVPATFPAQRRKCTSQGKLKRWRKKVPAALAEQPLYQFGLMFMFAPPLLGLFNNFENRGFEIVGKKAIGKSSLQRIMSSVIGGVGKGSAGHYWIGFDSTLNALEQIMADHQDLPLILDEANLFGAGENDGRRAKLFKAVAFKLAEGTVKQRWGAQTDVECRLMYLSSSNQSLFELIGEGADADGACDRLITIRVPDDRPYGTLDSVPGRFKGSAKAFLESVVEAASRDHGVAMRAYLKRLTEDRVADEGALKRKVQGYMKTFVQKASPAPNDASLNRASDAFALVYAAGKLAEEYGILPDEYGCGTATSACFQMHLAETYAKMTFAERVATVAQHPNITDLGGGHLKKLTDEQMEFGAFLRDGRSGRELLITKDRIHRYFPDWDTVRKRDEVKDILNKEPGRNKRRRKLSANHEQVRLFVFSLVA